MEGSVKQPVAHDELPYSYQDFPTISIQQTQPYKLIKVEEFPTPRLLAIDSATYFL